MFSDELRRAIDDTHTSFTQRAESLLRHRKQQLETAGFVVTPGRTRVVLNAREESGS
jgi:uncharacterized cupin superfamily protein